MLSGDQQAKNKVNKNKSPIGTIFRVNLNKDVQDFSENSRSPLKSKKSSTISTNNKNTQQISNNKTQEKESIIINNNNSQIEQEEEDNLKNQQQLIFNRLGQLFKPEEEDCFVAYCRIQRKKLIVKTRRRRKSPNTLAAKIGEKFSQDEAQENFWIDPKTGQVGVTLESGRQNLDDLKFVYPEDYYAKKNKDYANRQEKRKITTFSKKKQTHGSVDNNYQGAQDEEESEDFQGMEKEEFIKEKQLKKNSQNKEKFQQLNKPVFNAPYGQFSNSQIINNINQIIPQQEFPNGGVSKIFQQEQQQQQHHPQIIPEDQIEENSEQYLIQQQQLLNLNKNRKIIQGNTGKQERKQQQQQQEAGRTHLEMSKITKGIKKHQQKHGEKARQKSEKEKNAKKDKEPQQQQLGRQKQQKMTAAAKTKQKQQWNSLKIITNKQNATTTPTWRQLSMEDSRISQQKRQ